MIRAASYLLYTVALFCYGIAVRLASLFNDKAKHFVRGRKNIFANIAASIANDPAPKAWFHCASLGEFEQARPVIEALKEQYPQYKVIITFFSPSGYEVRKNYTYADYVFYLPTDTASNARRLVELFDPRLVFFVKYEFWHHYLTRLHQCNIPVYLLSANFRKEQVFFKWYGAFFSDLLSKFDLIFTQNEHSKELLSGIGITRVVVSRDTRFDRVYQTARTMQALPLAERFKDDRLLLIAGSSYQAEEILIRDLMLQDKTPLKVVIAPHETDTARIAQIRELFSQQKTVLYSEAAAHDLIEAEVLIIDSVGILSALYRYADIALVGGGFGKKGLHNILEAATFGIPILFGPNNLEKFPEAAQLTDCGGGAVVHDQHDFATLVKALLADENKRTEMGSRAKQFISGHKGATGIIMDQIRSRFI